MAQQNMKGEKKRLKDGDPVYLIRDPNTYGKIRGPYGKMTTGEDAWRLDCIFAPGGALTIFPLTADEVERDCPHHFAGQTDGHPSDCPLCAEHGEGLAEVAGAAGAAAAWCPGCEDEVVLTMKGDCSDCGMSANERELRGGR